MADKTAKRVLIGGAIAVGLLLLIRSAAAAKNAINGMPQFLVKGFSISRSTGYVNLLIQNPGNQQFNLLSVVANISDNGNRIATVSYLPGPDNPFIILPQSSNTLSLKVTIDPFGAIQDAVEIGKSIFADISKGGSVMDALGNNLTIGNAGELVKNGKSIYDWFQDTFKKDNSTPYAGTQDQFNDEWSAGMDQFNDQASTTEEDTSWQSDEDFAGGDYSGTDYSDYEYSEDEYGMAGTHKITLQGVVNIEGINIPLNQTLAGEDANG